MYVGNIKRVQQDISEPIQSIIFIFVNVMKHKGAPKREDEVTRGQNVGGKIPILNIQVLSVYEHGH